MAGLIAMGVVTSVEKLIEASAKATTSDIISLEIVTDTDTIELYGPPDYTKSFTLTGKIRFEVARPMTLRQVRVKFKGSTKVGESLEGKIMPAGGFMARDESFMLVQRNEILVNEEPIELATGSSEIPFTIDLPGDMPPSIYTGLGWLEYRLSAMAIPDIGRRLPQVFGRNFRVGKVMMVKRNYIRSLEIAPYMPTMRYKGQRIDKIEYEFEVPRFVCKEQGQIEFSAKIKPHVPTAHVKHILVRLDQHEEYRVLSKDPRRPSVMQAAVPPYEEDTRPASADFNVDPDEPLTWEYPLTLSLPLDSPDVLHSRDSPLIDITHKLRVRLTFIDSKAETPCWLSFPIVISTISDSSGSGNLRSNTLDAGNVSVVEDEDDDELPSYQSLGPNPSLPTYDMSNRQIALADVPPDPSTNPTPSRPTRPASLPASLNLTTQSSSPHSRRVSLGRQPTSTLQDI